MGFALLTRLYRRLGSSYPRAFMLVELQAAFLVTAGTIGLLALYYPGSAAEYATILGASLFLTGCSVAYGAFRILPRIGTISAWIGGRRDPESTARAWAAAVGLPLALIRTEMLAPILLVVAPSAAIAMIVLDLSLVALAGLIAAGLVAVGYGAILHYLSIEAGMRPVLMDINSEVSPRLSTEASALPLRIRLLAALPLINVITGLIVAAITGDSTGEGDLGLSVLVAIGVATTISLELTILLSRSILRPLADIQAATDAVGRGDFETAVVVTTADELGELAASFNQMVAGLRERERIREAFGTYLDEEVADHILSEGYSEEGEEAVVTILFCDVRGFTEFAGSASAREVVSELNRLFEVVVPVIAGHGGHVDKFEGDGLMAVFGAPRRAADHARLAVEAGLELDRRINGRGEAGSFEIGVGISSGRVIAGAIGGGGRLNFSVIGDAVNVAARVEAETRNTGDGVLITAATREALAGAIELDGRGAARLRGITEPVELFAPLPRSEDDGSPPAADVTGTGTLA